MHIYNYFLPEDKKKRSMNVFLDIYPLPEMDNLKKVADKTLPKPLGAK